MISRYTTPGFDDETVAHLQRLIRLNVDSRHAYRDASQRLGGGSLRATFESIARERDEQARALQRILWSNYHTASISRTVASSIQGFLVNLRAALGDKPSALLNEAMKAENHLKQQYLTVLDAVQGRAIRQLLQEQLDALKTSNERIRTLNEVCQQRSS